MSSFVPQSARFVANANLHKLHQSVLKDSKGRGLTPTHRPAIVSRALSYLSSRGRTHSSEGVQPALDWRQPVTGWEGLARMKEQTLYRVARVRAARFLGGLGRKAPQQRRKNRVVSQHRLKRLAVERVALTRSAAIGLRGATRRILLPAAGTLFHCLTKRRGWKATNRLTQSFQFFWTRIMTFSRGGLPTSWV
jgi:hypothetical protein